jgi:hypothetical protein
VIDLPTYISVIDGSGCDVGDVVGIDVPEVGLTDVSYRVARKRWGFDENGESYSLELPVQGTRIIDDLLRTQHLLSALKKVAQNKVTVRDQESPSY